MKSKALKIITSLIILGSLSSFLVACGKGSHLTPNEGWGNSNTRRSSAPRDDEESSSRQQDNSSNNKGSSSSVSKGSSKNSSNNGGGTSGETVTTDNPYFEFRWKESDHTASVRFMSGSEISEITIPSNYDRDGVNYRIINDDYEPGLGYKMDVTRIVLPEGFEEISLGFAHDMNLVSVKLPSTIKKIGNSILVGCNNFKTIEYNGTKTQWEAINKKVWNDRLPVDITIACKDGNITVPRDSSWD